MSVGHGGLYHSQSPEGFFLGAAGLKVWLAKMLFLVNFLMSLQVVVPRGPIQAKGLLLSSIRDPNPVVFFEPKVLYRSSVEHVPLSPYTLPLSSAEILRSGSDLTIVSWGTPLYTIETALSLLSSPPPSLADFIPEDVKKASVEVIDLRTILPWDRDTIVQSVKKTGRLMIVHEAGKIGGVGSEIASVITEECFLHLEAPVKRVTGWEYVAFPFLSIWRCRGH
jgi:2-oxoisovalerate dehydrogenase E1 component beta subunit